MSEFIPFHHCRDKNAFIGSIVQHHFIQDQESLKQLCQQLSQSSVLAIDTEFVRTRTLYPILGLLQVCDGEHIALIDPIVIEDLSPFWQLMTDGNIRKVLHACSEDLEVFLTAANCKPVNLIDSQVMMSFLGHGLSMGYAAMVKHYTEVELDKSESRTDWTKRPLTDRQLVYAKADVDYLFQIYPQILAQVQATGWLSAAEQETQLMIEKKFTPIDEANLYQQVKFAWRLGPEQLNLLKALAQWRYQQAKKRDLPIGFVAKDHTLMALAKHNPKSTSAMLQLEGIELLDVKHKGKAMLVVLKHADETAEQDYPKKVVRLDEYPGYKQAFKTVKSFIAKAAEQAGLTVENLASKKQINQFLSWCYKLDSVNESRQSVDLLIGWRQRLCGEELLILAKKNFKV